MLRTAAFAVFVIVVASGCGSSASHRSGGGSGTPTSLPGTTSTAATTTTPTVATIPQGDRSPAGSIGTKPTVDVPAGAPPSMLETADLIPGTGAPAAKGDKLTVQYVGVSYSTKLEFDSSWQRNQPFTFTLGTGSVIPGWDRGLVGMKVGGRRELVIPPDLAYGSSPPGPGIAPNDTLVFVVDLVSVG